MAAMQSRFMGEAVPEPVDWLPEGTSSLETIVVLLEVASAAVILMAAAWALLAAARRRSITAARHGFAKGLLFALDFAIAADILKTALAPNLRAVGTVGAIVLVRIALTVALVWELRQLGSRDAARP